MASRWANAGQGASIGAQTGAALGTVVPVVGTALGAGIGAGLGAIGGGMVGPSETEQARLARLKELQRRQELGTLGYTDQEINTRLGAVQGQAQQQMQADRQQQAALLGAQDIGAGSVAKAQQAQAQREQTVMAQLANQVQQEDMQKAAQQEAELAGLMGLQAQTEANDRQMMMAGVAGGFDTIAQANLTNERATAIAQIQRDLENGLYTAEQANVARAQVAHSYGIGGQ